MLNHFQVELQNTFIQVMPMYWTNHPETSI